MTPNTPLAPPPSPLSPFFLGFRLAYAPVVGFWRTEHGAPWLIVGLILLLSIGGEWMARRYRSAPDVDSDRPQRALILVVLALLFLGFLSEEGVLGLVLWAGIGVAWADVVPGTGWLPSDWRGWLAVLLGIGLGVAGIWGPAPWLAAGLLIGLAMVGHFRE